MLYDELVRLKARYNSTAAKIPKRVGASLQPCFTPMLYAMGLDSSPSIITLVWVSECNFWMMQINLTGQPSFPKILKSISRFALSKAFVKSMNTMCRFLLCSIHFSIICLRNGLDSAENHLQR